ncbi:MAG: hypothetical protein FWH01_09620 [Oscillospiraceae bacterium]|nr:hypothetical protein [Oscillospiraceae bacterium]
MIVTNLLKTIKNATLASVAISLAITISLAPSSASSAASPSYNWDDARTQAVLLKLEYCMYVTDQVRQGYRPQPDNIFFNVFYNQNGTLSAYSTLTSLTLFDFSQPQISVEYAINDKQAEYEDMWDSKNHIRAGTYDYTNDPISIGAYFMDNGDSIWRSLDAFRAATNNHAITQDIFDNILMQREDRQGTNAAILFNKGDDGQTYGGAVILNLSGYYRSRDTWRPYCILNPKDEAFGQIISIDLLNYNTYPKTTLAAAQAEPGTPSSAPTPAPTSAPTASAPPATTGGITAVPTTSTVLVDGKIVAFDAYNINDFNHFKLRDLAYTLDGSDSRFEVGWDGMANAIALTTGLRYTVVGGEMEGKGGGAKTPMPSDSKILLNGVEIALAAYLIDGNNYFKLRDVGDAIGFEVDWDESGDAIIIKTGAGAGAGTVPSAPPAVNASGLPAFIDRLQPQGTAMHTNGETIVIRGTETWDETQGEPVPRGQTAYVVVFDYYNATTSRPLNQLWQDCRLVDKNGKRYDSNHSVFNLPGYYNIVFMIPDTVDQSEMYFTWDNKWWRLD